MFGDREISIVEIGDFNRFEKVPKFASFLGLDSSGDKNNRYSITEDGSSYLRRLMVEATKSYTRGNIGYMTF